MGVLLGCGSEGPDLSENRGEFTLGDFGVVCRLSAQPIAVGKAEETAKSQVRVGGNRALSSHANDPLGWLVAALPSIVAVLAVLAFWRYLGEADELTRAIELRALAIAVCAGFIIWTATDLLGKSGVPIGDWPNPVVLVMIGGYVLARFLSGSYYR